MKKQLIIIAVLFIIGLIVGYTLKPTKTIVVKDDSSKVDSVLFLMNAQDTLIANLKLVIDSMRLEALEKEYNLLILIKQRDEAINSVDNIADSELQGYFSNRYGSVSNE